MTAHIHTYHLFRSILNINDNSACRRKPTASANTHQFKVPSNRGELAKMQNFFTTFFPSFVFSFSLYYSCCNNSRRSYPRVIYIPNMSHSKSDLGSHSPMAASIQSGDTPRKPSDLETASVKVGGKGVEVVEKNSIEKRDDSVDGGSIGPTYDHTHRKLKPRHVQLIGIGGTIGTALYVQIGSGLRTSGPGSLFLGFGIWYVYTPLRSFIIFIIRLLFRGILGCLDQVILGGCPR